MTIYYADPSVASGGTGSESSPWGLRRALNAGQNPHPVAGDTLLLRGSNDSVTRPSFKGAFPSSLTGEPGNPVMIKPYPGERFTIDSYLACTLTNSIDDSQTAIVVTGTDRPWMSGQNLLIIDVNTATPEGCLNNGGVGGQNLNITRHHAGTTAYPHNAGALIYQVGNCITLTDLGGGLTGNYQEWWLFDPDHDPWLLSEVTASNPIRVFNNWVQSAPGFERSGEGFTGAGKTGFKLYRGLIHDNQDGVLLSSGQGHVIDGVICSNQGHSDPARGHGLGLYLQAIGTGIATKRTVLVSNFSGGAKGFGETAAVDNITFDQMITIENGAPASFIGNPSGNGANSRSCGIQITSGSTRPTNCGLTNSFCYEIESFVGMGGSDPHTWCQIVDGLTVTDNLIIGGNTPMALDSNTLVQFASNRIAAKCDVLNFMHLIVDSQAILNAYTWHSNQYYDDGFVDPAPNPYRYTFGLAIGGVPTPNEFGAGALRYDNGAATDWLSYMGSHEAGSTYNPAGVVRPTGLELFVISLTDISPNTFWLVIVNWDASTSISIPAAKFLEMGFAIGDGYRLHSTQNYYGDVTTGTWNGSDLTFSMDPLDRTVQRPIGFTSQTYGDNACPTFLCLNAYRIPGSGDPPEPTKLMVIR